MRGPAPFEIERYFARWEFSARHLLSSSDCEPLTLAGLLELADDETRGLWAGLSLAYTDSAGLPALRAEIAGMYDRVDPTEVLEVVPEEGIFLAMQALLEPGDHVVVTWPAYQSLHSLAEAMGCHVSRWTPREADGWRFDVADLRALLRADTKLVVLNFPHNPTGYLPPASDYVEALRLAEDVGARVFSDEMYRWLEQDAADRLPSACEISQTAVTLCGVSKTFSLAGLRVGWLATRDEALLTRLAELKDYTTICGSAPSEVLALIGLRAADRIVEANLGIIRENLDAIDRFVASASGFGGWRRPKAGSVGLLRWEAPEGTRAACDRLAAESGIMLLPSSVFDFGDSHVRLGFGRRGFAEGLDALARHVSRCPPTRGATR
jgi:aspartate/methionine/tyrosine aminotransferase